MNKNRKIHGIVIGIDNYETIGGLRGCANDAMAFACRLERLQDVGEIEHLYLNAGYHKELTPTKSHLLAAVNRVASAARDDDFLFCYFAGHGIHDPDHGHCLLPIDFLWDEIAETALPLDALVNRLRSAKSKNIVLILDACRKLIGRRGHDELERSFSQAALELRGILTFAACMLGQVSVEFDEPNPKGLFTHALLDAWEPEQSNLTFQALYEATKRRMVEMIRHNMVNSVQQCSLSAEPIEKAYALVPEWTDGSTQDEYSLVIDYPPENTKAATVDKCWGRFSGELTEWCKRNVWVNLLDLNGNRYLQQPEVSFGGDGRWAHEHICSGEDIVALEVLEVSDFGRKVFEHKILTHSFGAFREVPEGTVLLARVKLS